MTIFRSGWRTDFILNQVRVPMANGLFIQAEPGLISRKVGLLHDFVGPAIMRIKKGGASLFVRLAGVDAKPGSHRVSITHVLRALYVHRRWIILTRYRPCANIAMTTPGGTPVCFDYNLPIRRPRATHSVFLASPCLAVTVISDPTSLQCRPTACVKSYQKAVTFQRGTLPADESEMHFSLIIWEITPIRCASYHRRRSLIAAINVDFVRTPSISAVANRARDRRPQP
jgi:hypothetical protein